MFLRYALLAALLTLSVHGCTSSQQPSPVPPASSALLIQNVRVFDPIGGTFSDIRDILIRGDRIAAVGPLGPPPEGTSILDAGGRFALPGLWDSHAHVSLFTLGGDSSLVETFAGYVRNGVTSVRDVGGHPDTLAALRQRIERGELLGPTIFFAGPVLSQPPMVGMRLDFNRLLPGAAVDVTSPIEIESVLDRLVSLGARTIKAMDYWDPSLFRHLLQAAQARSLPVAWDPGPPILNTIPIDTALALGVTSIEHAQAAWAGVLTPEVARVRDSVMTVGLTSGDPDMALRRMMALGKQSVAHERLDVLADNWARSGAYFTPTLQGAVDALAQVEDTEWRRAFEGRLAVAWLTVRVLSARGVRLLVGSDRPETDGVHREMDLLAAVGIRPAEILRGATIYPARAVGVADSVGTLEAGRRADILILDASPLERITNIRAVWAVVYGGRIVRSRDGS